MSECAPRAEVETCLAELHRALTAHGVGALPMRDSAGRACLEVRDPAGRTRRVHVYPQFFWFTWGSLPDERHSVFRPGEAAALIARVVQGPGWPDRSQDDLAPTLDRYLH
ncbi:hypothetical protein [Actinomadura craniellae]|nr:hypothetical protein [Actinomadura craniellae]